MVDLFKNVNQASKQIKQEMSPRNNIKAKSTKTEENRNYRLANVVQCYDTVNGGNPKIKQTKQKREREFLKNEPNIEDFAIQKLDVEETDKDYFTGVIDKSSASKGAYKEAFGKYLGS